MKLFSSEERWTENEKKNKKAKIVKNMNHSLNNINNNNNNIGWNNTIEPTHKIYMLICDNDVASYAKHNDNLKDNLFIIITVSLILPNNV